MTREEAVLILDPETRLKYLTEIEYKAGFAGVGSVSNAVKEALNMAIAALREQPQWINVEERLPECDEKCLCRYTFGEKGRMYFYQVLDYYATDPQPHFQHAGKGSEMRVTHWMPLPEPPKEEV